MKNRLIFWALMAMLSTPMLAHADGYNGYNWKNWRLSTSEGFNLDTGPSNVRENRVAFPMTQLLDGDPNTTWVWDDAAREKRSKAGNNSDFDKIRSFEINSETSVVADELWLMNGYNKSKELFSRNDRVLEIRISADGKTIKTVALSDQMGWHKIAIPRQKFQSLKIELTKIRKGDGKDNDICLSEMALYSKGKKVDFQMPRAVMYQLSYCCGGTGWLINRGGRAFAEAVTGEGGSFEWSPDGNRVAALDANGKSQKLWIADARRARVTQRQTLKLKDSNEGMFALKWKNDRALQINHGQTVKKKFVWRVEKTIAVS